ncbi:hypothetical protein L596_010070 [Steinernema carpocapsae]|uniref:Uncharacterized protein n=1 Tax=Steinernema carpocapsae TaxID=34508 RepID=A0A4U5PHQ4_STECR|nr:hypothetical protein L596_010070 [Steinernema carpocapsae]
MLKTEAPVVVCSYADKNLSQEALSMFFYTSVIKKLVNFLPRIRHLGCNQNDPFVHEVLFRSIDMGSLRSVHLRRCKLSKDIAPKITDWMRGREFKEFRMTAHDEDQSLFDRLINATNEIANELEQKHPKYQLYLHYDVLKCYPDFRNFAFMESFGLTGDFNLLHVCFQRL